MDPGPNDTRPPLARRLLEHYLQAGWHRGKLGTVRWLLRAFSFNLVRSHHGPILSIHPKDFTGVLAVSGAYGRVLSDHLLTLKEDAIFVDVGASYGLFTLLAAAHLKRGKVVAIEPNPTVFLHLRKAVSLNHATNVEAINAAMGTVSGKTMLHVNDNHAGMARISSAVDYPKGRSVEIRVVNPVDIAALTQLHDKAEVHVKLDIEGYELEILRELCKIPRYNQIRSIVTEIDDGYLRIFGDSATKLYATLDKDGFTPRFGLQIDKHYDEIFCR